MFQHESRIVLFLFFSFLFSAICNALTIVHPLQDTFEVVRGGGAKVNENVTYNLIEKKMYISASRFAKRHLYKSNQLSTRFKKTDVFTKIHCFRL